MKASGAITLRIDGKHGVYVLGGAYSTEVNGYRVWRLYRGNRIFYASFNSAGEYLENSFTPYGLGHATDLLIAINK